MGSEDITGLLLSSGANVELPNEDGDTLLAIAERQEHDELTNILKEHTALVSNRLILSWQTRAQKRKRMRGDSYRCLKLVVCF
jgi:ankyrin repeat protein